MVGTVPNWGAKNSLSISCRLGEGWPESFLEAGGKRLKSRFGDVAFGHHQVVKMPPLDWFFREIEIEWCGSEGVMSGRSALQPQVLGYRRGIGLRFALPNLSWPRSSELKFRLRRFIARRDPGNR
jgi:hypothetical protein